MSPISSRNAVPPPAASSFPSLRESAPVNAPFSWPKSVDSTSSSERATMFTYVNGPPARRLFRWMNSATTCFPAPLSPVRSTVVFDAAARTAVSSRSRIGPVSSATREPVPSTRSDNARFALRSDRRSRSRSRTARSSSKSAGLSRKSAAPSRIASTALSTEPWAVSTTTSALLPRSRSSRSTSSPDISGIERSSKDHVEFPALRGVQRGAAVRGLGHRVLPVREPVREYAAKRGIVVRDENGSPHGHSAPSVQSRKTHDTIAPPSGWFSAVTDPPMRWTYDFTT